jgi:hypothetical protein
MISAKGRKTSPTLTLSKPHRGGQRAIHKHPARFQVVACGRRFGKTSYGKLVVAEALFKYATEVWWIAPTYKMSSIIWRDFRTAFKPFADEISAQDRMMFFPNGASLTVWTGDRADTMRGGAPGIVIVDEAAMIKDSQMWPAVIRPALTDKAGRALFLSTPRGHNWFWELFNLGNDPLFQNYTSWQFPSWNNPILPAGEIDEAKATLPARLFDQEYGAQFIPDAGGVFRGVDAVATADYVKPYDGEFVMGIDWGREHDFTVISVIDSQKKVQVDLDRFNQISWELQRGRVRALYDKWKPHAVIGEENSIGGPNVEALQREGIPVRPFTTTSQSKGPLIESLALAIERQEITLLNDRVQTAELQAYEMERLPSGRFRYSAPEGAYDDTVMALALAWEGLSVPSLLLWDPYDD